MGDNLESADTEDVFYLTVTATGQGSTAANAVLLTQGALLAASFHPELTDDLRVHRLFLDTSTDAAASGDGSADV